MDSKLERKLTSIGCRVFVEYFHKWNTMTPEEFQNYEDFTDKSLKSRIGRSRSIFKSNLEHDAPKTTTY